MTDLRSSPTPSSEEHRGNPAVCVALDYDVWCHPTIDRNAWHWKTLDFRLINHFWLFGATTAKLPSQRQCRAAGLGLYSVSLRNIETWHISGPPLRGCLGSALRFRPATISRGRPSLLPRCGRSQAWRSLARIRQLVSAARQIRGWERFPCPIRSPPCPAEGFHESHNCSSTL